MSDAFTENDRRANTTLRAVFVEAYAVLEPFFDPKGHWGGNSHDHLAFHAVKERFPQLTSQDVLILVTTARRLQSSGRGVAHR